MRHRVAWFAAVIVPTLIALHGQPANAQARKSLSKGTAISPGFSLGRTNNPFGYNSAFGSNPSFTSPKLNVASQIAPRRGAAVVGGFSPGYRPGAYIQRGNSFVLPILDLGFPRNGFDPYVLQGFTNSNYAPQVYATPPVAYISSPSVQQGSYNAFPSAVSSAGLRNVPIEIAPPSPPRAAPTTATVHVFLPAENAELWFNGVRMQATGPRREFVTPELTQGQSFSYEVKVRWTQDGKIYEQTRTVNVQPGEQTILNLIELRNSPPPPIGVKV